jgi:PAS domain S-box-containing protein
VTGVVRPRVLVVGDDAAAARLCGLLTDSGLDGAATAVPAGEAEVVLACGLQALQACQAARGAGRLTPSASVVYVPDDSAGLLLPEGLAGTADEVIPVPVTEVELCARVAALCRARTPGLPSPEATQGRRAALSDIASLLTSGLDVMEVLQEVVGRVADLFDADRASLILFGDDAETMYVLAASDDPSVVRLAIRTEKYPEVRAARETREICVVENAPHATLLGPWAQVVAARGIGAIVCLPLCDARQVLGVLLLRFTETRLKPDAPYVGGRIAASLIALGLRGTNIIDRVREQTRRLSLARYEEERRLRALEKYRDFLESTTDAMFVTDAEGQLLYVNRAAEQLTGYAREALFGRSLADLVAEPQRRALLDATRQVASGLNLQNFDLDLLTTSGDPLIVSCATSSVLADQGAAILAFRDVTEARALQDELAKTKDFLERLIDSTVDAIVSADIGGRVILFNKGAERLTGFRAEEVIGALDIAQLYPEGGAGEVMLELRSPQHGGVGRLELCRKNLRARDGELIPVSMTASIIYEEGREVATVGIFSDMRERLRIEERLQAAQEKLVVTEKQALLAELAGTTAHELNQPLTSVMGCIELLNRRMGPDNPHQHTLDTIVREAERMAEIVRKIGKITRYETKAYVGSTQILDLDKATE